MEALLLLPSRSSFDFVMLALDLTDPELLLLIRSLGRLNSLTSALDLGHLDFFLSFRSLVCCDALLLVTGLVRAGLVFFLPVADRAHLDAASFLRSLA